MTAELTYRIAADKDLPAVLRLWQHETEWGTLTPELWRRWYMETPYGRSLVVVAIDAQGEIAAQLIMVPSRLVVDEREVAVLRLSALTLRKDLRGGLRPSQAHPVSRLCLAVVELASEAGYSLLYGLPRFGLVPFFHGLAGVIDDVMTAEYGCVAVSIPGVAMDEAGHLSARPVADFGTEYEALWQTARCSFPLDCAIVRSPDWLRYNRVSGQARAAVAGARHLTLEIYDRRDGLLVGYTAITTAASDPRSALLSDILTRHPTELAPVLATTLDWLATEPGVEAGERRNRLTAMETPVLQPALRAIGFAPVDYTFAFACKTLDSSLSADAVRPERWYILPGD
jgi:hypothetical protein